MSLTPATAIDTLVEGLDRPATEGIPPSGSAEYNEWRKSGTLPEAGKEASPPSPEPQEAKPAAKPAEAASEPATGKPEGEPAKPAEKLETRSQKTERRFRELLDSNKELMRQIQELKAGKPAEKPAPAADRQPEAKPAELSAQLKKIDEDFKAGKYKTYEDYSDERTRAIVRAEQTASREAESKRAEQESFDKLRKEVLSRWSKSVAEAKKAHSDFDEVFHNGLEIPAQGIVETALLTSPVGTEMAYHLGKNPEKLVSLNKMASHEAALELARIELACTEKPSLPVKKTTEAPPPPTVLGSGATAPGDAVDAALEKGDVGSYIALANARDLSKHKAQRGK